MSGGFTLVETLIAASIGALLLIGTYSVLDGGLELTRSIGDAAQTQREAHQTTLILRGDLEHARSARVAPDTLEIRRTSGEVVWYVQGDAPPYPLTRSVKGGSVSLVAENVTTAAFALVTTTRETTAELSIGQVDPVLIDAFEPGDWDSLVAATPCDYLARRLDNITGLRWIGQEFSAPADVPRITTVDVRVAAPLQTPGADLIVEVRESNGGATSGPGAILTSGTLSRTALTMGQAWHTVDVSSGNAALTKSQKYWLVFRGSGGPTAYAGSMEIEGLQLCLLWAPVDDRHYRRSTDGGGTWTPQNATEETFFRAHGARPVTRLDEVRTTVIDTVGVSYHITIEGRDQTETRAGYAALPPR
jgi:hypothetical protein